MSCLMRTGLLVYNNVLMKTHVNGYEIALIQHAKCILLFTALESANVYVPYKSSIKQPQLSTIRIVNTTR